MIVPDRVRLPLTFDADAMAEEVATLAPEAWVPHYNTAVYEGSWAAVALRSPGGVEGRIYADPAPQEAFAPTPVLNQLPAVARSLEAFGCHLGSARLLALDAGAVIRPHEDLRLGWDDGEIRVHVPIITAEGVSFILDGVPVAMLPGEAWYLDFRKLHEVANRSAVRRIHLVVDCDVDDWLTSQMRRALAE